MPHESDATQNSTMAVTDQDLRAAERVLKDLEETFRNAVKAAILSQQKLMSMTVIGSTTLEFKKHFT